MKTGTRLYINITNKCNTNCPFCCMYSSTANTISMQFDTFKKIIDDCEGDFELQLEGGEPLVEPKLYLFIEYAISTGRCTKVIILSNGIALNKHLKRLVDLHKWYNVPFEMKISVNYWLMKVDKDHLAKIADAVFVTEYIPGFQIYLNTRKRNEDTDLDDIINQYANLKDRNRSFFLQSYGRMTGTDYDGVVIVQNIDNWKIYAVDGTCFDQDLVARSEYEKELQ